MKKMISFGFSLALLFSSMGIVHAEGEAKFKSEHKIYREKVILKDDGTQEKLREEVKSALPGEELVGVLNYTYMHDKPADNTVLTTALQKEFVYVEGSATDEEFVWFSADGGKTYARFVDLRKIDDNGVPRIATGKDVTHLQWRHARALNQGDSGVLEYRVTIR